MAKWTRQQFRLPQNHGWRAKPGYKIFVANRGAARFDIPTNWILVPGEHGSVVFHDREPPDDTVRLEFSLMRLDPSIDWAGLPIEQLFQEALKTDKRPFLSKSEPVELRRPGLELVWAETVFIDPGEKREARSRICLARGHNIMPLLTMDLWSEDAEKFGPVWEEVLASLELGHHIEDPLKYRSQ